MAPQIDSPDPDKSGLNTERPEGEERSLCVIKSGVRGFSSHYPVDRAAETALADDS